jgi:hypothetical protein
MYVGCCAAACGVSLCHRYTKKSCVRNCGLFTGKGAEAKKKSDQRSSLVALLEWCLLKFQFFSYYKESSMVEKQI